MLRVFNIESIKKYKWIIIAIIALIVLIFINIKPKNFENLENVGNSVRIVDDYFTSTTATEYKVLNLKCSIKGEDYVLGKINKEKFNSNCLLCSTTNVPDSMLVLTNTKEILIDDCYKKETINCLNSQTIKNCNDHVLKHCDPTKNSALNFEFILDNISTFKEAENGGVISIPAYLLKFNDIQNIGTVVSPIEIPNIEENKDQITQPKNYLICFNKIVEAVNETHKIYIEDETTDKVRFKMYFNINNEKRYIGVCKTELCPNIVCKDLACADTYKFLCLYDDKTNENVIAFEPTIVKMIKAY